MSRVYTILLTSAGGLTGIYLCKHFKKSSSYRIIAIDMSEAVPLKMWVDAFYVVPAIKSRNYLAVVKEIILNEGVDIIIPVTSYDVDFYSQISIREELYNIKMLLVDFQVNDILSNKKFCYEYLASLGIRTPRIYRTPEEVMFPCILKPIIGSGSRNVIKIEDQIDYEYWSLRMENYILIEYIDGKEYTVDCLFDKEGKCLGANVRERVKMNGGGAIVTCNDYSQNIESVIQIMERIEKLRGPINFQFKRLLNGECCVFDVNTRFASGGLPLTVESGFDIPNKLIQIILNEYTEKWYPEKMYNGYTMIKYYEEFFINSL
ncbi:carbamoyl-phosphate synthase large subunit [Ruminiclostridium sufflavum DSM 19573]|uniref:Carbamoyl-phosphate synthase large subunit n=1 Tax=Ruminiclostridium sufflavum DSM 19573 TaxID=1121337 RepID=A0A318XL40_9FIRM|nr:ATP-grasp domain-containing protein [Ruminiclostridium sufflavum]PYG87168.1 carbamoyl-phosphate synthase large subunit [Ruminiclostridium sufflavum DSM 19573]